MLEAYGEIILKIKLAKITSKEIKTVILADRIGKKLRKIKLCPKYWENEELEEYEMKYVSKKI